MSALKKNAYSYMWFTNPKCGVQYMIVVHNLTSQGNGIVINDSLAAFTIYLFPVVFKCTSSKSTFCVYLSFLWHSCTCSTGVSHAILFQFSHVNNHSYIYKATWFRYVHHMYIVMVLGKDTFRRRVLANPTK